MASTQDTGRPAGQQAAREWKPFLSSTHRIPGAGPGVWQGNLLVKTSWLDECHSPPQGSPGPGLWQKQMALIIREPPREVGISP